jgi:hypothetical protein
MCANRRIVLAVVVLCGWLAMTNIGSADFITGVTATAGSQPYGTLPAVNLTNGWGMTPSNPVTKSSTTDNNPSGFGMWLGDSSAKWLLFTFGTTRRSAKW